MSDDLAPDARRFRAAVEDVLVQLDAGDLDLEEALDAIDDLHLEEQKRMGVSMLRAHEIPRHVDGRPIEHPTRTERRDAAL